MMKLLELNKKLILEDGSEYFGKGFGDNDARVFEIVFNTSPVGYQEILSDPSYTDQSVVMAYSLIGNSSIISSVSAGSTPESWCVIFATTAPAARLSRIYLKILMRQ